MEVLLFQPGFLLLRLRDVDALDLKDDRPRTVIVSRTVILHSCFISKCGLEYKDTHLLRDSRPNQERIFKPTTEAISVVMKSSRQKLAGSLKTRMPMRTVPTAPMPVHTG